MSNVGKLTVMSDEYSDWECLLFRHAEPSDLKMSLPQRAKHLVSVMPFLDTFLIFSRFFVVIIKNMSDLLFLAIIVVFLLATAELIILCQRLMK
jgi:hypothetical protein